MFVLVVEDMNIVLMLHSFIMKFGSLDVGLQPGTKILVRILVNKMYTMFGSGICTNSTPHDWL